tara:strand:+ start:801 stop:989 length:189 start_codon:yes stop_codon:yes gene_type:complete
MIGNAMTLAISMMTEKDFWDKFNRKHNPQFYEKKNKKKKTSEKKKSRRSKSDGHYPVFKVSD